VYKDQPLGAAVKSILIDEFKHEDVIVTQLAERKINPERIRNIFLGLNDGLVEILGAVSGFFGAFGSATMVLLAGTTTAVAGSLSMAAGVYVAMSSEREIYETEDKKQRFLSHAFATGVVGRVDPQNGPSDRPLQAALVVGVSYFAGAMVPLLPVVFGARNALFSMLTAGSMAVAVSMLLAFSIRYGYQTPNPQCRHYWRRRGHYLRYRPSGERRVWDRALTDFIAWMAPQNSR